MPISVSRVAPTENRCACRCPHDLRPGNARKWVEALEESIDAAPGTWIRNRSVARQRLQRIIDHFGGDTATTGETPLQPLKSSSETLDSSLRKATMVQISWSGTGGSLAAKL